MQNILETPPNIHKRPRETEQLAMDFILPKIKRMRLAVLIAIANSADGLTGSEVVDKINGYIVSVRPRLTELHDYNLIKPGDKRKNNRGMYEIVWTITSQGMQITELVDEK